MTTAGLLLALGSGGCLGPDAPEPAFTVEQGRYTEAFEVARDTLHVRRYRLERIDARSGVLATRPKTSAGLATPWHRDATDVRQATEDLFNRNERRVRITFEPVEGPGESVAPRAQAAPGPAFADLRQSEQPLVARVEVVIERVSRPGWQVHSNSVRASTFTRDPQLAARRMEPRYSVAVRQDEKLARRLAGEIQARLDKSAKARPPADTALVETDSETGQETVSETGIGSD